MRVVVYVGIKLCIGVCICEVHVCVGACICGGGYVEVFVGVHNRLNYGVCCVSDCIV